MLIAHDSWYRKLWAKWFYTPLRWYVHQISALLVDFHFHLLFSAVGSYWQVIWKKFSWNFHFQSKVNICTKFQLSRLIFIFINCYQIKKNTGIFMYTQKLILVQNFSSLCLFLFSSTLISWHQLSSAVDSRWQLIWKKIDWNFHVHTKFDTYTKLSSPGWLFINCYQLLSAVDSWWQLKGKKIDWNSYVHTIFDTCAKFQLS